MQQIQITIVLFKIEHMHNQPNNAKQIGSQSFCELARITLAVGAPFGNIS